MNFRDKKIKNRSILHTNNTARKANIKSDNIKFRMACENGHVEIVQWLTQKNNMTAQEAKINDNYAFKIACENGHLELIKCFIKQGFHNEFLIFHRQG